MMQQGNNYGDEVRDMAVGPLRSHPRPFLSLLSNHPSHATSHDDIKRRWWRLLCDNHNDDDGADHDDEGDRKART